jgi:peptidoglycan/LPS O-acetylase OafA/YrhL
MLDGVRASCRATFPSQQIQAREVHANHCYTAAGSDAKKDSGGQQEALRVHGIIPAAMKSSRHIPELDGIRGTAVALVVIYHYFLLVIIAPPGTALSYIAAGKRLAWSGVDLFFVLSGFLIGGILIDARESVNYYQVFYYRRFLRIVPLYVLVIVLTWVVNILANGPLSHRLVFWHQESLPWRSYIFFVQNFWMTVRNNMGYGGLRVTWSLAVEEQFYLTLPFLIRRVRPDRLFIWIIGGIAAAPVLRIICHALWPEYPFSWVYTMPCRADALLLGVLGAIAMRSESWRNRLERHRASLLAAVLLLAFGCFVLAKLPQNPSGATNSLPMLSVGLTWLALFYLSIILYALIAPQSWLSGCLRWHWLRWLGSIAYGVYMFHDFIRSVLQGLIWGRFPIWLGWPELAATIFALALTLGVCELSWAYFERPLLRAGHKQQYIIRGPATRPPVALGSVG